MGTKLNCDHNNSSIDKSSNQNILSEHEVVMISWFSSVYSPGLSVYP